MTSSRSLPVLRAAPETRSHPVFPLAPGPVRPGVGSDARAVRFDVEEVGPAGGARVALITLGCDKNTVDSERMMAALAGHGARVCGDVEGAEVVVINTCGFIEAAREQSIETILEACALKERGGVRAVVAVGCMVERYRSELEREIPEVDLFMGLSDLRGLVPELRRRALLPAEPPRPEAVPLMERPLRVLATETPHSSFLKISEGCDHTCAFCAIPLMRGLHRSAPLDDLVSEARALGEAGVRELSLVSQDTTWWGRDLRRRDPSAPLLPDLLRALLARTSVDWYRLFYMYPSGLTPELVGLLAEGAASGRGPRLLPYLDVPLQHGSDRMLAAMRRPERRATIRERVGWLRDAIADLTLRTTVIVGFPGESDDDFEELKDLIEELEFDRVGAFAYSPEEGTLAATLPDPVPASLAKERLEELMDVQRSIALERNLAHVGRVRTALVDRLVDDDPDYVAQARTEAQAADVDGVTHILAGGAAAGLRPGAMVEVEITDAQEHDLVGRVMA